MKAICLTKPSETEIRYAAELIRAGRLVAFPTETVYGLGANALNAAAVDRIFAAKGRPSTSPLIVHVDGIEMARSIVSNWPDLAQKLAVRFWPGALTLVLPKRPCVPDRVTAGLSTVGVRVPAHPVALALIREAGVPIAAPSANRFTQLSPTTAEHVRLGLEDRVALILDGGPTAVGIESTVLSLAGSQPVLLRPGMISQAEIESIVGPIESGQATPGEAHPSPGLHPRHYSPRTRLLLVTDGHLPDQGHGAYLWIHTAVPAGRTLQMPADPADYAAKLYAVLHQLDQEHWDWIAVEHPPRDAAWTAILDRLQRAQAQP